MAIVITYRCGHEAPYEDGRDPQCVVCGDRHVVTVSAPPPTFRGTVTGPSAITEPLPAIAVDLTRKESHG